MMQGHLAIDRKTQRYSITKAGYRHIGALIDEAETIIDEFDDWETVDMVAELRARNLDPLRARFLWGWYQGEFDDLVQFQERRGISPVDQTGRPSSPATNSTPTSTSTSSAAAATTTTIELRGCSRPRR